MMSRPKKIKINRLKLNQNSKRRASMKLGILNSKSNQSGMIFVTVVILTVILSIIVIGVIGLNVSQVKTSQSVIDDIKAEQVAKGAFYKFQQGQINGTVVDNDTSTLNGRDFDYSIVDSGDAGADFFNTNGITVTVDY